MLTIYLDPFNILIPFIIGLITLVVLVGLIISYYRKGKTVFPLMVALITVVLINIVVGIFFFMSL